MFFAHSSGIAYEKTTEFELRELKFRAPDNRCLAMLQAGCGIYRPVLAEGPDAVLKRRFILPPVPEVATALPGGAVAKTEEKWTVGIDCCGLMVEWEAILTLLGRKARLVWASDSDPIVKKYVLDKYKSDIWYDNVFRLSR